MLFSKKLQDKIKKIYINDSEMIKKLLAGDADAISKVGIYRYGDNYISPKKIVECYENQNMEYLYEQAKRVLELEKLYVELCDEYYKEKSRLYEKSDVVKKY